MSRMRFFPVLLFQLLAAVSFAQGDLIPVKVFERHDPTRSAAVVDTPAIDTIALDRRAMPGDVKLIVDPRIDRLMELHAEHDHVREGFRVQIFLGDRKTAEETKRTFLQKHPDVPAYMSWLAPNFRLRVGDLRTRLEAENLLHQLRPEFPGSYIVPDQIELARLITDN